VYTLTNGVSAAANGPGINLAHEIKLFKLNWHSSRYNSMLITPHSGGSTPGGLVALRSGVAAPSSHCSASNGGTSARSKHGVPEGGTCNVRFQHTKDTPNGGTSTPNNLGTPSGGPLSGNLGNGGVSALRSCDTNERFVRC
jgi:hypothetical protein